MCGIAGLIDRRLPGRQQLLNLAGEMAERLTHRGPDDRGVWAQESAGVALGFRRLAIIDLSPAGHQPMESACSRYVISFNGEVYNHREMRNELQKRAHRFTGTSDTEVMLAAISEWGLRDAVGRFVGMFAFALWDSLEQKLYLVRDRLGIKPLYYSWTPNVFLFASELKALHAHPSFIGKIDRRALALMQRFGYIPDPHCIYDDARKLLPGNLLVIPAGSSPFQEPRISPYWSIDDIRAAEPPDRAMGPEEEAESRLDALIREAVRLRMIADVPVGAFLSGGIDSSMVVAVMQGMAQRSVKTFTIGFEEEGFNEANQAREVAKHLGTDHTELVVTASTAQSVIPRLPEMFDEPFADSSQIPTYLVSALARRDVTVSLSGDGGDELFNGYDRYVLGARTWKHLARCPRALRDPASKILHRFSPDQWDAIYRKFYRFLPPRQQVSGFGRKIHKLANLLAAQSPGDFYRLLVSQWQDGSEILLDASEPTTAFNYFRDAQSPASFLESMARTDLMTYMPGDILAKVDRASMSVGLEARVPLLDHRIVEFALRLPMSFKVRKDVGKYILRKLLYKYVPQKLVDRPKMGFGVPIGQWLRGPLREWAQDLLDERAIRDAAYFRADKLRQLWSEHLTGQVDWSSRLWTVLMFQSWLKRWKTKSGERFVERPASPVFARG